MKRPHDSGADYYDLVYKSIDAEFTDLSLETIRHILPTGGRIIDFGAGTGRLAIPLAKMGYHVSAIEQSNGMVNVMRAKANQQIANFEIIECSNSNYKGSPANLVISVSGALNYILDEVELINCFKSFERNVLPGGHLILDFLKEDDFDSVAMQENPAVQFTSEEYVRTVKVTKTSNEVYDYSEFCKGLLNGEEFEYEDHFKIRRWWGDEINEKLKTSGFNFVKNLSNFNSADYICNLYKKQN